MDTCDSIKKKFILSHIQKKNIRECTSSKFVQDVRRTIELQAVQFRCNKDTIIDGLSTSEFDDAWYVKYYEPIIFDKKYDGRSQIDIVIDILSENPTTRQAMLCMTGDAEYSRTDNGMICTNTMQFLYTPETNTLQYIVYMRSNDVARFPQDLQWHYKIRNYVMEKVCENWGIENVNYEQIIWNCASFHIYEDDWHLLKPEGHSENWYLVKNF